MAQLTFAAIWTELTFDEKTTLTRMLACSMPVLALKVIPEELILDKFSRISCYCEACSLVKRIGSLVGRAECNS